MAGHGGEQLVVGALNHGAGIVLRQLGQHAAGQRHRVRLRQRGRHRAHRQGLGRKSCDLQAQRLQRVGSAVGDGNFLRCGGESRRNQQRLAGDGGVDELGFQTLINNALVRRMHVDDHQTGGVLGEDVDALQLRQRPAQRPLAVWERGGLRCSRLLGHRIDR